MSLFEKLRTIKEENLTSFHVPGHKNSNLYRKYFEEVDNLLDIDLTEFPGTDDLHSPEGCILKAQEKASQIYKSKASFFLVNGTTCGIYAMMTGTMKPGDKVLVARDAHRAVFNAIQLGDLKAVYLTPEIDGDTNLILGLTPESVADGIKKHPDAKALVLTYPNYNGICCDLKSIEKIVHDHKMLLLIDEAHGAHLLLSDDLPASSIEVGADIVVQSSHKSLPVMTQASILHVNTDRVAIQGVKDMLTLYQTSSPSYVLMASLDIGMTIIGSEGKSLMEDLLKNIQNFKDQHQGKYHFLERDYIQKLGYDLDVTKLTLLGKQSNIDPKDFEGQLRKNGVQAEYSTLNNLLFVTSICNESKDFLKLSKSMENSQQKCYSGVDGIVSDYLLEEKLTIRAAFYASKNRFLLKDAIHKVSGTFLVPYPPGIPLLIPGEIITEKIIQMVQILVEKNQKIVGMDETYTCFDDFYIQVVETEEEI